jgi:outer membrane protein
MKPTTILFLSLFLTTSVVFGQLEKGNFFVQGSSSLGFNSEKYTYISDGTSTESSKSTSFRFRPKAGYFIMDNLPVGLDIYVNSYKSKSIGDDRVSTNSDFTFGPFARYYFLQQDKLMPMAEIYAGLGSSKDKTTGSSYDSESKYGVFEFGIGAGASYFITDHVAFDLLLSYYVDRYNLKSETSPAGVKSTLATDKTDKYTGINLSIGIAVTIPKK